MVRWAPGIGPIGAFLAWLLATIIEVPPFVLALTLINRPPIADFRHPPSTVNDLLAAAARTFHDLPAIIAPDRDDLTHAALAERLETIAQELAAFGLGRGSRIAVALPEGPESVVAVLAVCCSASCVPLNPDLDDETLFRQLTGMRVDAVIAPERLDSGARRAARRGRITVIDLCRSSDSTAGSFWLATDTPCLPVRVQSPELDDAALLMYTSGTTAASKIVPGTHRRLAEAARVRAELGELTPRDRCLLVIPLYNNVGIRRCVLPSLTTGGSIACVGRFDAGRFVEWLECLAPTYYMASSATQAAMLETLERRTDPVRHSLRFCLSGGAPLASHIAERLERELVAPVLQGYGLTETGNIAQTPLPPRRAPAKSVGLPSNIDILIVDDTGREVAAGETGEILVRGPEVFDGYENNPEANAAAFLDGWFRTGDTGHLDRGGFLFLSGRVKDIINRGGTKVAPADVEDALMRHPQVIGAAAFALAHPTLGEDVAAAVVLRDARGATESDLRDFARTLLAPFKVPTRIAIVDEIPRGSFDKVKRAELARIAEALLRTEFVAPRDREETEIVRAFVDVLEVDRVGAEDNFFQLGGDSLRAARVVARLQTILERPIALDALFRHPTAVELAGAIRADVVRRDSSIAPSITPLPRSREAAAGRARDE